MIDSLIFVFIYFTVKKFTQLWFFVAKIQKTRMLNALPSYLKKSYLCRRKVVKDFSR